MMIDTDFQALSETDRFNYLQAMEVPVWIPRDEVQLESLEETHQIPSNPETFVPERELTASVEVERQASHAQTSHVQDVGEPLSDKKIKPTEEKSLTENNEIEVKPSADIVHYLKMVPWVSNNSQGEPVLIICRHQTDQPAQSFAKANMPSQLMQDYVMALNELHRFSEQSLQIRLAHLSQAGLGRDCQLMVDVVANIQSKVILILGDESVKELLVGQTDVASARGKIFELNGIQCLVSYHPYTLMTNPSLKRLALEDLKLLSGFIAKQDV